MQTIPRRPSLLDCFNNYCIRTQSQNGGHSPTHSPLKNSRHSIQMKLKEKPSPNVTLIPKSSSQLQKRKFFQEGRMRKVCDNRGLLNITPVVVHTPLQSYKQTIRTNSSITIKRKLMRAKTDGEQTDRSSSLFFTQQRVKQDCETPMRESLSHEVNKNRPFTAFPSSDNSINRLRTIQIDLPKRSLGRAMSFFDETVSAWETHQ